MSEDSTGIEVRLLEDGNIELSFQSAFSSKPEILVVQSAAQASDLIDKLREVVNRRVEASW